MKSMDRTPRSSLPAGDPEAGGMIVEVAIASAIVLVLMGIVLALMSTGLSGHATGTTLGDLERDANRVLDRIASELVLSGSSEVFPKPSTPTTPVSSLTYRKNTGYTSGSVAWGVRQRIEMQDDPRDPDDGVDNDGNGLVDEKILVLITDPGGPNESSVTLVRGVRKFLAGEEASGVDDNGNGLIDEPGFACTLDTAVWTIRLTLERSTKRGEILSRTAETSITPRN